MINNMDLLRKILVFIFGVLISLGLYGLRYRKEYKKVIKKLQDQNNLLEADFHDIEAERIFSDDSIRWINKRLKKNIELLRKFYAGNVSIDSEKVKRLLRIINEDMCNIEAVLQEKLVENSISCKLPEKIEELIKDVKSEKKEDIINISISKDLSPVLSYDNEHLIATLRLILLKSIEKGSKKINVVINPIFESNEISKLTVLIENIKFIDDSSRVTMEDIDTFFDLSSFQPNNADCKIEAEFYIIRQNIMNITKCVHFFKKKKQDCMTFEIKCKNYQSNKYLK